jgi:hypothetical protein
MVDEKWCGDLTEIRTEEGKLHLASASDFAAHRIPGFALDEHHHAELATGVLKEVAHYIDRYNTTRRASSCEMHSPVNYDQIFAAQAAEAGKAAERAQDGLRGSQTRRLVLPGGPMSC